MLCNKWINTYIGIRAAKLTCNVRIKKYGYWDGAARLPPPIDYTLVTMVNKSITCNVRIKKYRYWDGAARLPPPIDYTPVTMVNNL